MTFDRDKAFGIIVDHMREEASYMSPKEKTQLLDELEECYKPLDYQLEANKIATETFRTIATETFRTFLKLKEGPTK